MKHDSPVLIAKIALWMALLAVTGSAVHSALRADTGAEFSALPQYHWFITTLVDFYAGILLVSLWALYRERKIVYALPWIPAFCLLGNIATAAYALYALRGVRESGQVPNALLGRNSNAT